MRILLVSAFPPPLGGIATWTLRYVDYCKKNGIEIDFVNISLTGRRAIDVTSLKVNLVEELIRSYTINSELKKKLMKPQDIIHINTSLSKFGKYRDYFLLQKSKKKKIPIILHCHCNIPDRLQGSLSKAIFSRMVKLSSKTFVMNSSSAEYIEKNNGTKAILVPNFIEEDQILSNHVIRSKIERVLYVGHVQKTKGCEELVNAALEKPEVIFDLVGPVDPDFDITSVPENVIIHGNVKHDRVKQYLIDADVFVLPSYSEGFSISLLEAMACGLPIITTNVGANFEMTEEKGSVIIPVKSSYAIVEALEKIQDETIRREMSCWNTIKVKQHYSEKKVMDNIFEVYKGLSGRMV